MIIYKTINLVNEKIYIGYDTREDPEYYGSGLVFKHALKKYGKANFRKETIDFTDDFEELCEKEIFWIKFYNAKDSKIGYNISDGGAAGHAGCNHSEETKQKMSVAAKGKSKSEEYIREMSIRMSDGRMMGKNHPMFGRKHSEEAKRRMSLAQKGKSSNMKGKRLSEETKQKISRGRKEYFIKMRAE